MRSASQHTFAQVPSCSIPRSAFKRDCTYKTTFNAGYLVPCYIDEALPGDTWKMTLTQFCRMQSPLKYPILDNLYLDVQFFAVPYRLLFEHWENVCGVRAAGNNYEQDTDYLVPVVTCPSNGWAKGSIADYFGIRTGTAGLDVSALFFRAYNKVYNDWYRDENLISAVPENTGDGPDSASDYVLRRRCKRHDYFTSCLPWPQKGPGVELPLGTSAPVIGTGMSLGLTDGTNTFGLNGATGSALNGGVGSSVAYGEDAGTTIYPATTTYSGLKSLGVTTDKTKSGMVADLSDATAATINSLRQAFQLQRLYERDAVGGTRMPEILLAHFGVRSPDARLQRSEFLGSGSTPIQIHTVASTFREDTSGSWESQSLGSLGAYGVTGSSDIGWSKSFVEHSVILGLVSVRADLTYQQGVPRMFSRRDRFDFYWPALAHLGEQPVYNREIFAQGTSADSQVFGYQERFGEYRYGISKITGEFRSDYSNSLDVYHLSQDFSSLPTLSETFIEENPPIDRVVCVTSSVSDQFLYDALFSVQTVRPMPLFGTPGLIDHL